MILSGQQPNYVPWIGYFHKVGISDKHVLVDNVQYVKKHVTNRNKIKTPKGPALLTVPVLTKGAYYQKINEVKINNDEPWQEKHWKSLNYFYLKAPHFEDHVDFFRGIFLDNKWTYLADLNLTILKYLFEKLEIQTPIYLASEHGITGKKNELIVNLTKGLDCDTYLSGAGARKYIDEVYLSSNGVKHIFQEFHCPTYPQMWGKFVPNLSVIDLLFNVGPKAKDILSICGQPSDEPFTNSEEAEEDDLDE